jgi:hypothetical protein
MRQDRRTANKLTKHNKMDAFLSRQDPKEITDAFFKITDAFTKSTIKLKADIASLDDSHDSRIVSFTTLREVANSSLLSSIFLKDHLTTKDWWASNKSISVPTTNSEKYIEARIYFYGVDLSTNYLMLSFTHFENSLRSIVKAIPSTKFPDASEDFWKIRNYLVDHSGINSDYKELIKIFQTIRNSFHNGGFHNRETESVTYKSKTFTFEKNKPISFDLWSSIEFIMLEVNQFLLDLMTSKVISEISVINHPFGIINFITKK